jgi:hypothetical protein
MAQAALPVYAGPAQTTYSCTDAGGVSSLTNVPTPGAECVALYTSEATVDAETPATASAPAEKPVVAAVAPTGPKTPAVLAKEASDRKFVKAKAARAASALRDNVVSQTAAAYAAGMPKDGNPAVSRRYLKADRSVMLQQNGVVPR